MSRIERRRVRALVIRTIAPAVAICAVAGLGIVGSGIAASATESATTARTSTGVPAAADDRMGEFPASDYTAEARDLPAALTDAVRRDLDLTGAEYLAQAAAAVEGTDVVASLEDAGVPVLGSRLDGTTLVVNVPTETAAAAVTEAGGVAEIGAPDEVDVSSLDFIAATDVSGGEGYVWQRTDGSGSQCSIGLTGRRISDGAPVALTAGHCIAGMASIAGSVRALVQSAPGSGGTWGQAIGTPAQGAFGNGFDGGLITLDAPNVTPTATVLTWGGGTGASRSSAALPVEGVSAAIVGANLCKSGSRTGWTCGTVRGVDRSVNVGGNRVNSIIASTCLQPGDSGGSAMIGRTAVGVNSSTSSAACGTADYISAFFPMVSAAGLASVQSQFGSIWEPSVALQAPTLTSMTVPSPSSSGALVGTATGQSSIAVFVDDASEPALTVPVSNDAFVVDLGRVAATGVTAGTHRIRIAATSGAWSRSTGIETTLQFGGTPTGVSAALLPSVSVSR